MEHGPPRIGPIAQGFLTFYMVLRKYVTASKLGRYGKVFFRVSAVVQDIHVCVPSLV
jgi:hypothetical protein